MVAHALDRMWSQLSIHKKLTAENLWREPSAKLLYRYSEYLEAMPAACKILHLLVAGQ